MNTLLKRFWFKTEEGLGIGVTAYSIDDAKSLVISEALAMSYRPIFDSYVEDIDIHKLDQNHVMPNMGIVVNRGIWYPKVG
jgi:hypothetical protein